MKKIATIVSLFLVLIGSWLVVGNAQYISDSVVATQYQPSGEMRRIIADLKLTDEGQRFAAIGRPELSDQSTFNKYCRQHKEQSIVLGCYISPYQIYVYNITDPQLDGIREVTTAHEMLHVAYDRLSAEERQRLGILLEQALPAVQAQDATLAARLELYEKTEPGERQNELHSILGTEAADLPSELEEYYARYFKDRRVVTGFAANYSSVFIQLKSQQDTAVAELESLAQTIEQQTAQYNEASQALNQDIQAFNARAASSDGFSSNEEFTAEKNLLIARRDILEQDRQRINDNIARYNEKRNELQSLNVQVDELNAKLDSTSSF